MQTLGVGEIPHLCCDLGYIPKWAGALPEKGYAMYTLGSLVLLAILLGALMPVVDSLLAFLKLDRIVKSIPIVGTHLMLGVSILMVWALDVSIVSNMTGNVRESWMTVIVDGAVVYGMVPVKDAIVSFISKGLTGLRAA